MWTNVSDEFVTVSNLQNTQIQLLSNGVIELDGKMYLLNGKTASDWYGSYKIDKNKSLRTKGIRSFVGENQQIYMENQPNITKPRAKSNYVLRELMQEVIFAQSGGNNINIIRKDGTFYENVNTPNRQISNIKKLISSASATFVIDKQGTLYAKGGKTGLWGDLSYKSEYEKITKDGTNYFNNVKNVFTSKAGIAAVFLTEDNKMFWAGSTSYIQLPGITGEIQSDGWNTRYAQEVHSTVIDEIAKEIKDIKFFQINSAGVSGTATFILTESGRLYVYGNSPSMTGLNKVVKSDFEELVIASGQTIEQIAATEGFTLALLSNGEVYGWGHNTYGIMGNGYEIGGIYRTPQKLALNNIDYMSLGNGFAIFASKSGEVYGIGKNDYGQLGTGDNEGASEFVRCPELEK